MCRTLDLGTVREALKQSDNGTRRHRDLPAEAVVYFVIAMALYMPINRREVLFCLMERLCMVRGLDVRVTGKSGISQARSRIGAEPLRRLYERHVHPIATLQTQGAWYCGRRLVSLDGSTLDIPDEADNRKRFRGPSTVNDASPFLQVRFVCLAEIGTRVWFAARMAGYHRGEATLAHEVIPHLQPDMLCLADRGFFSRTLWKEARETGADLLWRVRADIRLPVEKVLPDGSYLSSISTYRSKRARETPIPVRVVEYQVDGVDGGEDPLYRMATSMLEPDHGPRRGAGTAVSSTGGDRNRL